jgi:farnesyl diphosphate synthase
MTAVSTRPDLATLSDWAKAVLAQVESALEQTLPPASAVPQRLHQAMRYAVLQGGKRVRPLLAFAAGEVSGAAPERLARAAVAVELIHAYSLVHDDLPCMDDDVLRRGKPTVHVAFDEATALLVGDALQTLAFEVLASNDGSTGAAAESRLAQVRLLAEASGSHGMAGGQAIDLASVGLKLTLEQLEQMHRAKTGALLRAAVLLGATSGTLDANTRAALEIYARAMGLAFQVVDDVLDVETDTALLGKTAGKDAEQNKPTYVSILGLAASRQLAERLRQEALSALQPLGAAAERLRQLADLIVLRKA